MKLVFRLLSEDLIEAWGAMSAPESTDSAGRVEEELCRRIAAATGCDEGVVFRTIRGLVEKGYLRAENGAAGYRWGWTHNNRCGEGPAAFASAAEVCPAAL
jgi:hypothetical protein